MAKKQKSNTGVATIQQATQLFLTKAKIKLKESTFSTYSSICERHIIPYFENIDLHKITDETINDFINYKLTNGGSVV